MATNLLTQRTISLDGLRSTLIRLEDSFIFALVERAQFARNAKIYRPGAFQFEDGGVSEGKSFLDYFLHEVEVVQAKVRRYTSPDEYAFTSPLPDPILPPLPYPRLLVPNNINVNDRIKDKYINELLPCLCPDADADDLNHGSAATKDVELLQVLSKRIHMGKYIAETKFLDQAQQPQYVELIRKHDVAGLEELLTDRVVEARLLDRLRRKARIYGSDLNDNAEDAMQNLRVQPEEVAMLYERFVIPLTKAVEVEYLLVRLQGEA